MKKHGNYFLILLPILLLVAGSVLAEPKKAGPNHGAPNDVTECGTVINEPGKYRVMNDILDCTPYENGVIILTSDVILDLRGHTISCARDPSVAPVGAVIVGWSVGGVQNVLVRNGTVIGCDDGILLGFTDGVKVTKMYMEDNSDGAITLVGAVNSEIRNNTFMFNGAGIRSFSGSENQIKGNSVSFAGSAIELDNEVDSIIKCNTVEQSFYGISAGPFSSGNILQGNLITEGFFGIMLYGVEEIAIPPDDPVIWPVASGNLVKHNMALGNFTDLQETTYVVAVDDAYVAPGATCQNTWMSNQFGSELGPSDCIGFSVELDEDDVCALDDD